jgi:hypothetical protein
MYGPMFIFFFFEPCSLPRELPNIANCEIDATNFIKLQSQSAPGQMAGYCKGLWADEQFGVV